MPNKENSLMMGFLQKDFNCTFFICTEKIKTKNKIDNLITQVSAFLDSLPLAYGMQVEDIEIPAPSLLWSSLIKATLF